MSDFVLEYESLEEIARYSRALGKSAAEYGENLEQQIITAIGNVTGSPSGHLMNANDSVRKKINELKQKSDALNHFAEQILQLLEAAKEIDQEVADAITAQSGYFLEHHESLRLEDWKAKLLYLLVDIKNSASLLSLLGDILNGLNPYIKSLQDSIKHGYKCQDGKYVLQTSGTHISAAIAPFPVAGTGFAAGVIGKAARTSGFVGSNPNTGNQNLSPEERLRGITDANLKFPGAEDIISKDLKKIVKDGYRNGLINSSHKTVDTKKDSTLEIASGSVAAAIAIAAADGPLPFGDSIAAGILFVGWLTTTYENFSADKNLNATKKSESSEKETKEESKSEEKTYGDGVYPEDPSELVKQGWKDATDPRDKSGNKIYENPKTGEKVRYDGKGDGKGHYHRYNPDSTGRNDRYLDKNGNPVRDGSKSSHIYPE